MLYSSLETTRQQTFRISNGQYIAIFYPLNINNYYVDRYYNRRDDYNYSYNNRL